MTSFHHVTVLQHELVDSLQIRPGDTIVDCTAGGGGHTEQILRAVGPNGLVVAIDRDQAAIDALSQRFAPELAKGTLSLHKAPFSQVAEISRSMGLDGKIQAIAADLGVSSPQIDLAARGFSFQKEGPLDMRMSPDLTSRTAADIVAEYSVSDLTKIFQEFGEEPQAFRIAQAIVRARMIEPITTTTKLATLVANAIPYAKKSKKNPATKIFQALRIYVNEELAEVKTLVTQAFKLLRPHGRLAIITFHSLEDRVVKHFFQEQTGVLAKRSIPRDLPVTDADLQSHPAFALYGAKAKIIKPFPLYPSETEMNQNPRARSAKLRVLEKFDLVRTKGDQHAPSS